jgi:hypothetical protein
MSLQVLKFITTNIYSSNGVNYIMRSLVICTPSQYCAGGKIEKNEMGGAFGAYGGGERCAMGSGGAIA